MSSFAELFLKETSQLVGQLDTKSIDKMAEGLAEPYASVIPRTPMGLLFHYTRRLA